MASSPLGAASEPNGTRGQDRADLVRNLRATSWDPYQIEVRDPTISRNKEVKMASFVKTYTTSRRTFLGAAAAGAGTMAAVGARSIEIARAQPTTAPATGQAPSAPVLTRSVGRIGEVLPALGLGTFLTFDLLPGQPRDHLREVTRIYLDAGVRVIDTSPLYGTSETSIGQFIDAAGVTDRLFIANKVWSTGEYLADESHALRSLEQSQSRLWRARFDLMQCHSLVNTEAVLPILQAWKKEGRIRYVGVTHYENEYHDAVAKLIETGNLDFVQINYSIYNRGAEERVLRAAAQRGVGVFVNMALEKARLHKVAGNHPLPDFAREFGATSWAQFFLKFAMSHPAVTTVLCATSNPAHATENVGALRGPLPDQSTRTRMIRHMESIPGFDGIGRMPWYPDKLAMYQGVIRRSQGALRQRMS
jgi:diketogulonate reductase-like aldo/keto reductase